MIRGNSGSFTLGKYHLFARLNWWEDYCIEENYSVISCALELMADGYDYVSTWYTKGAILVNGKALVQMTYDNPTTHKAVLTAPDVWEQLIPSSDRGTPLPWVSEKIYHDAEGKASFTLSTDTLRAYRASDGARSIGTLTEQTLALTTIPRASAVTAAPTTLGLKCAVTWTPLAESFTYGLDFALGDWRHAVADIAPGAVESYTYTGLTLPMELAWQLPDSAVGELSVTLTTYSGGVALGSAQCAMAVAVPQTEDTRPGVEILSVTAVDTPFEGLFLQNKSRVKGDFQAQGRYGATVKRIVMTVEGSAWESPWLTTLLQRYGEQTVTVTATDSRGFTGSASQVIRVIPYDRPRVSVEKCQRCDSQGLDAEDGTSLALAARQTYSKVIDHTGAQRNFCRLRYRYAPQGGQWSPWLELPTENDAGAVAPALEGQLSKDTCYSIAVGVTDTAGGENEAVCTLPTEAVFLHYRAGGTGLGIGRYCQSDGLLDVAWDTQIRGRLLLGDDAIPLQDYIRAILNES